MFSFSFDKDSDNKADFFLKNIPLFLKFIDFFRLQAVDLIDDKDRRKIAVFPNKFSIEADEDSLSIENFLSELNKPFLLKSFTGETVSLTRRESECFKIFLTNKSAKEIANILNLSPRTVELHISNIKHKLGVNYKNQLLTTYSNRL